MTVGVAFLERKGGFHSTPGDLGEDTEPGGESTLAQPGLLNYTGSLLRSLPAPSWHNLVSVRSLFLRGDF